SGIQGRASPRAWLDDGWMVCGYCDWQQADGNRRVLVHLETIVVLHNPRLRGARDGSCLDASSETAQKGYAGRVVISSSRVLSVIGEGACHQQPFRNHLGSRNSQR